VNAENSDPAPTHAASSGLELLFVLTGVLLLALLPVASGWLHYLAGGCSLIFLLTAVLSRGAMAVHVLLLTAACYLWIQVWPSKLPFFLLGPLLIYGAAVWAVPFLRRSAGWLRMGVLDRPVLWLVGLTVVVSSAALVLWFLFAKPDVSQWVAAVPKVSMTALVAVGFGFAVLNAIVEESIYRGIVMHAVERSLGPGLRSIILQMVPFGLIHLDGIPSGWVGVGLAMIYGLMLGWVRLRSRGMLAPIVAHIFTDIVIFSMLVLVVR